VLKEEFRDFITKGNLVEIAVAFIMALAFAAVVASFVADIVTPIIAAVFGQPDFSRLTIDIGESAIAYGKFLNALITFLIVLRHVPDREGLQPRDPARGGDDEELSLLPDSHRA
jgi:large conductance mechanosensitive channel protein